MVAPHVSYSSSYSASLASGVLRNLPGGDVLRSGWFVVNKFGNNPDIGTATGPMDVWDGPSLGANSL